MDSCLCGLQWRILCVDFHEEFSAWIYVEVRCLDLCWNLSVGIYMGYYAWVSLAPYVGGFIGAIVWVAFPG